MHEKPFFFNLKWKISPFLGRNCQSSSFPYIAKFGWVRTREISKEGEEDMKCIFDPKVKMLSSRWLSFRPKRDERGCNPFIAILHNLLRLDEGATAKLLLSSCPCFTEPLCKRGQLKTFRSQVCRKRHTNIPMINIWETKADNKHLIWIEENKNGLKIGLKWAKNARESRKRITKCGQIPHF